MNKFYHYSTSTIENIHFQKKEYQIKKTVHTEDFDSIADGAFIIKETIALAKKVAPLDTAVLLFGETDTDKELFARIIHSNSKRSDKPFVSFNCAAFSNESPGRSFLGYRSIVFIDMIKDKIDQANGGTLFLDEIEHMRVDLRLKLIDILERKEFIKAGDIKMTKADVRIIAATNRNQSYELNLGDPRTDFFYPCQYLLLSKIKQFNNIANK
jgi:two-component system NtrC family response regulator